MSQEAAPEQALPEQQVPQSVPEQQAPGAPKGLLQQMEELMAALSADLSQLDADLQSSAERLDAGPVTAERLDAGPAAAELTADGSAAEGPAAGRHDSGPGTR
ncbi:hypothetical protein [Streptomyces roseolus]|uniref:hypothetical protein n=1 Tax=Streptomyces roseolus TaxID=67358 RepID=UPI001675C0D4|nr:hypothetical protein [Streptomyces roseolus]GGR46889.1 hypothetical protein GCM10010282_44740 [Streptomyces roseolus]